MAPTDRDQLEALRELSRQVKALQQTATTLLLRIVERLNRTNIFSAHRKGGLSLVPIVATPPAWIVIGAATRVNSLADDEA